MGAPVVRSLVALTTDNYQGSDALMRSSGLRFLCFTAGSGRGPVSFAASVSLTRKTEGLMSHVHWCCVVMWWKQVHLWRLVRSLVFLTVTCYGLVTELAGPVAWGLDPAGSVEAGPQVEACALRVPQVHLWRQVFSIVAVAVV